MHRQWERFSLVPEKKTPGRVGFAAGKGKETVVVLEQREYNGFNELVYLYRDGYETRYAYRPDGLRHKKLFADGTSTTHIWDGQSIAAEYAGSGNITARYLRGINLIAREQDSRLQYYLYNAHGDVIQRTDENGTALKGYDYDAFGNEQTPEPLDANPFRYCGEYYDREAETLYLRARSYDARTGRFTAEDGVHSRQTNIFDPYGYYQDIQLNGGVFVDWTKGQYIVNDPLSLNLYVYVASNPVRFIDLTGKMAAEATIVASNWWNPLGWVVAIILATEIGIAIGAVISTAQTARENAPIAPSAPTTESNGKTTGNAQNGTTPLTGEPNSSTDIKNKDGKIIGERHYGPDGRAEKDVDFTDHGNPKRHPEVPHEHKWDWTNPQSPLRK